MFQRLLNNSFIRSTFIFGATNFVVSFIAYIGNLLVAKNFALSAYGEYATALSYLVFFGVPLTAFGLIVIERIGRAPVDERESIALSIEEWLKNELISLVPLFLLLSIVIAAIMYFKGNMSLLGVAFVLVSSFLGIFLNYYGAVLQGYKVFWSLGVFNLITTFIKFCLYLLVVVLQPTLFWLFLAFIVSMLISCVMGSRMIRMKKGVSHKHIRFAKALTYLQRRSVLVPLITTLGIVGLSNIDVVLVRKFFSEDVSGLYASLSVLAKIMFYAVVPLSAVSFSFFTGSDTKHQSMKILALITCLIGGGGAVLTLIYSLLPELVINLVFNSNYLSVSNLAWMSAVFGTSYSLMYLYAQYFISIKSRFAFLGILAVVLQIVGIYIAHSTLYQVLIINILVNGGLTLVYMAEILRRVLLLRARS